MMCCGGGELRCQYLWWWRVVGRCLVMVVSCDDDVLWLW